MISVSSALTLYRSHKRDNIVDIKRLDAAIRHLNNVFVDDNLCDIDVIACRGYIEARREQFTVRHGKQCETSDSTIARELGVLKAAANHALKWKRITLDKMPTFEIPTNLSKGTIWLLDDELRKLYITALNHSDSMYAFIRLLYITGSRRNAIENLEWTQVDFKRGVIYLNKPGQKETKKRRPTVPMGDARDVLENLRKGGRYVLGSNTDRYRQFMHVAQLAGLDILPMRDGRPSGRISPHVLRHTRATHLLENGMPIYSVAKLLGDNPTTVEKVYAHACVSKLENELEKYSASRS